MTEKSQSPEAVALELYNIISGKEHPIGNEDQMDREYILSTYSECLKATKGFYKSSKEKAEQRTQRALVTQL